MAFCFYWYERPTRKHYRWWHNCSIRSRLKPRIEKAHMIHRGFENIVTFINHRITNAASESMPSNVQWVKTASSPLSISTAAASISCPLPTEIPECPYFLAELHCD